MLTMNYAQLVTAIEEYTETSEATFVSQIPTFVQLAEERIYNTVDLPSLRRNVTGTLTINNKYLSVPSDFLSVYSLAVIKTDGTYEYLFKRIHSLQTPIFQSTTPFLVLIVARQLI